MQERIEFTREMKRDYTILIPNMLPVHLKLVRDVFQLHGYRMVLLSNTNPYITAWAHSAEFFRGRTMDSYFDHLYFSCDLKLMKPGEEIFRRVLNAEGFTPEETLFIDDSTRNCATAQALGIHTLCPQGNSDWTGPIEEFLK